MKETTYIPYEIYQELKDKRYKLDKGIKEFNIEDLDQAVIFFDSDHKYIDPSRFEFERIIPSYVLIPRFLWFNNYDKLLNFRRFMSNTNEVISFEDIMNLEEEKVKEYLKEELISNGMFTAEVRKNQRPIIEFLEKYYLEHDFLNGILQAKPGTGKTFVSIYMSQFYKKTIFFVPKEILADQFKKEILNFTSYKEEDIKIIEGSDIAQIKKDISEGKIFIGKIQSVLSQIKRIPVQELIEIYKEFDFVVYDECHSAGAAGYSKVLSLFRTPHILGLSATPFRRGINEFILQNSIGEVIYEADAEVLTPDIQIFRIPDKDFAEFTEKEKNTLKLKRRDYIQFLTFFNMFLSTKNKYFDYLADWVNYCRYQNHESVILFSTNKMANKMAKFIEDKYPNLDKPLVLVGDSKKDAINLAKQENKILREKIKEIKAELDIRVKNKELKRKEANEILKKEREANKRLQELNIKKALDIYNKKIKEAKIIISNFNLLREGFDKPRLSHVIFGSPIIGKISVVQTLGRITRLSTEDKPKPLAQFFMHDIFLEQNKNTLQIIRNNVLSTYPEASFKYEGF